MSREPDIVDVMEFYLALLNRLPPLHDRLWAWLGGLAIALLILTVDRRSRRG